MKSQLLCIALCATIMLAPACRQQHQAQEKTLSSQQGTVHNPGIARILYAADSARNDIALFDSLCTAHFQNNVPAKAFTIRAIDLFDALGMPYDSSVCTYTHIRVYMGYQKAGHNFKLFIVPVKDASLNPPIISAGIDYLLDSQGHAVPPQPWPKGGNSRQFVLDLNTPCPSTCDMGSPLMKE